MSISRFDSLLSQIEKHEISFDEAGPKIYYGNFSDEEKMYLVSLLTTPPPPPPMSCSKRALSLISKAAVNLTQACASRIFRVVLRNPLHSVAAATTAIVGGIFGGPTAAVVGGVYLGGRVLHQRICSKTAASQKQLTEKEIEEETNRVIALIKNDKAPSSKEFEPAVKEACEYFILKREEFIALWQENDPVKRLELAQRKLNELHGQKDQVNEKEEINEKKADEKQEENDSRVTRVTTAQKAPSSSASKPVLRKHVEKIDLKELRKEKKPINSTSQHAVRQTDSASKPCSIKIEGGQIVTDTPYSSSSSASFSNSNISSSSSSSLDNRADSIFFSSSSSSSASSSSSIEIRDGRIIRGKNAPASTVSAKPNGRSNVHSLNGDS